MLHGADPATAKLEEGLPESFAWYYNKMAKVVLDPQYTPYHHGIPSCQNEYFIVFARCCAVSHTGNGNVASIPVSSTFDNTTMKEVSLISARYRRGSIMHHAIGCMPLQLCDEVVKHCRGALDRYPAMDG